MTNNDNNRQTPQLNLPGQTRSNNSPDRAPASKRAASSGYQGHQTQLPPKDKPNSTNDKPRPTPQEARQTYYKWLERLEVSAQEDQVTKERLDNTRKLTARLSEPNILAVYRLVEIFGLPVVEEKVERALTLHKEAQEQGEAAYKLKENPKATRPEHRMVGTEVATAKGQPRTPGGIFFFIMRGYVIRLRLAWEDLRVPWLPDLDETMQTTATGTEGQTDAPGLDKVSKGNDRVKPGGPGESGSKFGSSKIPDPTINQPGTITAGSAATKPLSASSSVPGEQQIKPSRGKVVITGSPRPDSQLKVAPQGLAGVLELLFEIEPGANPAKGLPVLEKTLVRVWFTDKQYHKIKDSLNPASRYLIEGEIGAGINSQDFQPFIRVLCTRLTTIELEQEAKQKKAEQGN
jgi:hypothetical protein